VNSVICRGVTVDILIDFLSEVINLQTHCSDTRVIDRCHKVFKPRTKAELRLVMTPLNNFSGACNAALLTAFTFPGLTLVALRIPIGTFFLARIFVESRLLQRGLLHFLVHGTGHLWVVSHAGLGNGRPMVKQSHCLAK
jgi:hypothetical protein